MTTPASAAMPEARDLERDTRLAARGDADAFERLYRETVPRVHALARRMAGDDVADDLTQEVYLRAWRKLGSFRGEAAFATWLHRLAVNLILTRRASIRKLQDRMGGSTAALEVRPDRPQTPGLKIDVEAALVTLPEGARDVFVLYDVEGYSHREIGERLGISVGTSKSQLHRARMLLRERLMA